MFTSLSLSLTAPLLLAASALATTTVYMRIEGPTHTIYEQTLQASTQTTLTNNGHTAKCDGAGSETGVTSLTALAQTGQSFYTNVSLRRFITGRLQG